VLYLSGANRPARSVCQCGFLPEPKTLKERLGDNASDDQRVNDRKVPVNQRGPKKRLDCDTSVRR
jgi:hypothetical protein